MPTTGLVYLDSAPVIYGIENHPLYSPALVPLWLAVQARTASIVTSEITIIEGLVGALRRGDRLLADQYRAIRNDAGINVVSVDTPVIERAAELRAQRPSVRTPDAIHLATAELAGCGALVTNDKSLRSASALNVIVLDDLVR